MSNEIPSAVTHGSWIEHTEQSNPLPPDIRCEVKLRNGEIQPVMLSGYWDWTITDHDADIMEYRVVISYEKSETTQSPTAFEFLQKAVQHMEDRAATYDQPEGERSMYKCIFAFNIITGRDLTESEGWLLMQILKDVRQWQRPDYHQDSAEDCIAYAALKAEALAKGC